jgi:hypothetical protein
MNVFLVLLISWLVLLLLFFTKLILQPLRRRLRRRLIRFRLDPCRLVSRHAIHHIYMLDMLQPLQGSLCPILIVNRNVINDSREELPLEKSWGSLLVRFCNALNIFLFESLPEVVLRRLERKNRWLQQRTSSWSVDCGTISAVSCKYVVMRWEMSEVDSMRNSSDKLYARQRSMEIDWKPIISKSFKEVGYKLWQSSDFTILYKLNPWCAELIIASLLCQSISWLLLLTTTSHYH